MPYFDNDGCQLHYEDYGHGTPLLLVHGLGSSTRDWEYQIPALSPHYRVIALDVRGHGRSDKPREAYRIADFADDVAALIEHLQLPSVHLVGISMGGMIGFQLGVDPEGLLQFGRQTGGCGLVVSDRAVLDVDLHAPTLSRPGYCFTSEKVQAPQK